MDLLKYFYSAYPQRTIVAFLAITVAGAVTGISVSALLPLFSKAFNKENSETEFFDSLFAQIGINPTIENLLAFIVIGIILKNIILAGANIYAGFTVAKIVKDLRIKLLTAMSRAEWRFYINQTSGKIASSLMYEADRAGSGYYSSLSILSTVTQIIAYMTVACFISWPIVVFALVTSILLIVLLRRYINISKNLGEQTTFLSRNIIAKLTDSTRSIKSLKAMSRESHSNALLDSYTKKLKKIARKAHVSTSLLSMFQEILIVCAVAIGIYFSLNIFHTSIDSILVLTILYLRALKLFGKTQKQYQGFVNHVSGFHGILDSIKTAEDNFEQRSGTIKHKISGDIKIDNISFSHQDKLILDKASAVIFHNKLNSVIGLSGAGKTTFVDLVCGLYKPSFGEIYIDNIPLSDMDITHWRSQIGYVVQETTLLNTSIKENVTLGDDTFTKDQVLHALQRAHAEFFINQLTSGIETLVGENGTKLSGGQKQRILIARALVHSPKLLILDEATSALDSETEIRLSNVFKELSKEITIISISHRPALVDISDHIIELSNGKLYEATPKSEFA